MSKVNERVAVPASYYSRLLYDVKDKIYIGCLGGVSYTKSAGISCSIGRHKEEHDIMYGFLYKNLYAILQLLVNGDTLIHFPTSFLFQS